MTLTDQIREQFHVQSSYFKLTEKDIKTIWNNGYKPKNIFSTRSGGFISADRSGSGICYYPRQPEGLSADSTIYYDCDDRKYNPFARRKEVADAETRLGKILIDSNLNAENLSESDKQKLKKYQEAGPSTFEYQVYHLPPFTDYFVPATWRDKKGKINYRKLIDKLMGSEPENNTPLPPQPDSYSATSIEIDKEFNIERIENGSNPDQITLKLAGFGYTIEGIGGVNYNYVVINPHGQNGKFLPGRKIKVSGIEMGPGKTYVSYHNERNTLNISQYRAVELINSDDNSNPESNPSVFEIIFNAITEDSNLQQILQQANVKGDFFLNSIAGRESDFVNGNTINYQAVRVLLGISAPTQSKPIQQVRNETINEITNKLSQSPSLTNADLPSDYQNWQERIKNLNEETKIKNFRDAMLVVIKTKREELKKSHQHNQELDEASSPNATDEQRVKALKDSGDLIGKETHEQKAKMEQIEKELEKNPAKLREAIQGQLVKQMADQKINENELVDSKADWEKLKTELDPAKIKSIRQKVSQEVGSKGAEKK